MINDRLTAKELRKSIIKYAISGNLTEHLDEYGTGANLLKLIFNEHITDAGKKKQNKEISSTIFKNESGDFYENKGGEIININNEIPFEIPDSWAWTRQGNICWLDNGIKSKGRKLPYLEAKVMRGLKQALIKDEGIIINTNDIVILVDGENSGELMIPKFEGYMGSTFKKFSIVKNYNYEFMLLLFELNKDLYKNSKKGAAIPHLNKEIFKNLLIPVPPLKEQETIVKKMRTIISLIEKYEETEAKLAESEAKIGDDIVKSILLFMLKGKLTKQNKLFNARNDIQIDFKDNFEKRNKVKFNFDCSNNEELPFEIPENWVWTKIKYVSESYIGLTYKPSDVSESGKYLVLRSSNIQNGKIDLSDKVKVNTKVSDKLLVNKDDILICARNGSKRLVGKSAYIENDLKDTTFGAFMAICKSKYNRYIYYYLQSSLFFDQLFNVSGTTTINQLTQKAFNEFLIPIPPIEEQKRIVEKLNDVMKLLSL